MPNLIYNIVFNFHRISRRKPQNKRAQERGGKQYPFCGKILRGIGVNVKNYCNQRYNANYRAYNFRALCRGNFKISLKKFRKYIGKKADGILIAHNIIPQNYEITTEF